MKPYFSLFLALFTLLTINSTQSQNYAPPELEFVCELKVTVDQAMTVGQTAHGTRIIIPISGGTFEGPLLKGTVLKGGADYQYANNETGRTEIEAIYTIKTDDNVLIHIRNAGLIYAPKAPSGNGPMDFNNIYFRAAPKFEAPVNSKYDWMNNAIFVCKVLPTMDYISIQVWKVL